MENNPIEDFAKENGLQIYSPASYDRALRLYHAEHYARVDYDTFRGKYVSKYGEYGGDVKKKETTLSPTSAAVAEQPTKPSANIQSSFGIQTVNPTQETQNNIGGQPLSQGSPISPNQSQFGWSDSPTQAPATPQYATNVTADQASDQYRKETKQKDLAGQSTSKEFSNTLLNSNSPLIKEKSLFAQSLTRDVKPEEAAMIQQNFSNLKPEYQQDVANYLAKVQVENPSKHAELVSRIGENGLDQKTKANILGQATNGRLQTAARDFAILEARNKSGKEINQNDAEETVTRYNQSISDMSSLLQQFPEELDRVRKIKAQNDQMTIKDSDSFLTKAAKQTGAALAGFQNALLDGAKSTLEWARDISDQLSGEQDTRGLTDKAVEGIGNFLDSWHAATPTKYKDEKDLQGENTGGAQEFIAQLGAQFGNMGMLYALGAGSKARLVTAGAATSYSQYYDEADKTGKLSKDGVQKYALFQSTIQGLLELVNPNFGAAEFEKVGLKSGIEFLKNNPNANVGNYVKNVFKETVGENAQELTQNTGGVLGKVAANALIGKDVFDPSMTAEEQMQTVTMTTATTLLASFITKGRFRDYHRQSLDFLRNIPEAKLIDELNQQVQDGNLTYTQADKIKTLVNDKENTPVVEGEKQAAKESPTPSVETPKAAEKVQEVDLQTVTKDELLNESKPSQLTKNKAIDIVADAIKDAGDDNSKDDTNTDIDKRLQKKWQEIYRDKGNVDLDEGFANTNAFNSAVSDGSDQLASHGMAKSGLGSALNDLERLLTNGIDPNRGGGKLDTAPLTNSSNAQYGTTGGGTSYRDGAFILVAKKGEALGGITDINQVGGILVNNGIADSHPEIIDLLREKYPNLIVESYNNVKGMTEQLNNKNTANTATTEQSKPSGQSEAATNVVESNTKSINNDNTNESNLGEPKTIQDIGNTQQERELGGNLQSNAAETPKQRTERVNKTVKESGLSKDGQRVALGIVNGTNEAKLDFKLNKEEKAKVNEVVSSIYQQDKLNTPEKTAEQKAQDAAEAPVKKEKSKTALQTGQKVGTNAKEFDQFEPTNIREELEQYLAKGGKINEADFQGMFGDGKGGIQEEGKKWKDSIAPDAPSLDQATEGMKFKGDAQEMKDAFESIVRENENRGKVGEAVKAKHKERKATLEGKNNPFESEDYEKAMTALEEQKAATSSIKELSEQDAKNYHEHSTKVDALAAQAESDPSVKAKHDEIYDRISKDPQYQKEDGTFDYDKLEDNVKNGFEPDILEIYNSQNSEDENARTITETVKSVRNSKESESGGNNEKGERGSGNADTRTDGKQGDGEKGGTSGKVKFTQASRGSRTVFVQKAITDVLEQVKKAFPNVNVISDQTEVDAIKAANPELADAKGFVHQGQVYIDLAMADPTTPVHEFAHVWVDLLEKVNTPQFDQVKKLIEGTVYYAEAKADNPTKSENDIAKEAMVRAIEADSVRALSEGKVKQAVTKFKDWMRKFFKIPPTFNVSKMTLEDFVRQANKELLRGTPLTNASSLDIDNLLKNKSDIELVVNHGVMSQRDPKSPVAKFVNWFREYILLKGNKLGQGFQNRIRNADARERAKVARYADNLRRWKTDLLSDARELSEADAEALMKRENEVFNGTRLLADIPPHRRENMRRLLESKEEIRKAFLSNMEEQGQVVMNQQLNPLLLANYELQEKTDNRLDEINKEYDALFDRVKGLSEAVDNKEIESISNQLAQKRHDASATNLLSRLQELDAAFKRIAEKNNDFDATKQDLLNKVRDLLDKIQKTQNLQGIDSKSVNEVYGVEIKALQKAIEARENDIKFGASKTDLNAKKRDSIAKERNIKTDKITKAANDKIAAIERDITGRFDRLKAAENKVFKKEQERLEKEVLEATDPKKAIEKFKKNEAAHEKKLAKIEERKNDAIAASKMSERIKAIKEKEKEDILKVVEQADEQLLDYPDKRIDKPSDPRLDTLNGEIEDLSNELAELLEKKKGSSKEQLLRDIDTTRNVERKAELNKIRQKDTVEIRYKRKTDGSFDIVFYQRDGSKLGDKDTPINVSERDLLNMRGFNDNDIEKIFFDKEGYLSIRNPQLLLNNPLYEKIRKNDNYTRRSYRKHHETLDTTNIKKIIGEEAYNEGVKAIKKMYETPEMTAVKVKNTEGGEKVYVFLNEKGLESEEINMSEKEFKQFLTDIGVSQSQRQRLQDKIKEGDLNWFKFDSPKGRYSDKGVNFALSKEEENRIINEFLKNENKPYEGNVSSKKGLDTTMLKKRGNIDPALRGLMGEYTDPIVVATRTIMDAAVTQQKDKYHQMLLSEGLGTLFLTQPNTRTGHTKEITKMEMATLEKMLDEKGNPITKLYTTEELYDGLLGSIKDNEFVKVMQFSALSNLSAIVKTGLTVMGVDTRTRDLLSNMFRLVEQGQFKQARRFWEATKIANADADRIDIKKSDFKNKNIGHIAEEILLKGVPQSFNIPDAVYRAVQAARGKEFGNAGNAETEAVLQEIREADLMDGDIDTQSILQGSTIAEGDGGLSRFVKASGHTYQKSDVKTKILMYWGEKQDALERGLSEADARLEAARRTRLTMPDYSQTPKFAKILAVTPIVGNFIMYKTESFRTYTNGWKLGVSDIVEGQKDGNKAQVKQGARRIASLSAAVGVRYALYKGAAHLIAAALVGALDWDDDKDTEAMRKLQPDYAKNSQFSVYKKEGNIISIIDFSFTDPEGDIMKMGIAAMRGGSLYEKFTGAAGEAVTGYADVDIALKSIISTMYNRDTYGGKIRNTEDDLIGQGGLDIADYLWNTYAPKFLTTASKIYNAALLDVLSEAQKPKGGVNTPTVGNELMNVLLGIKTKRIDLDAMYKRAYQADYDRLEEAQRKFEGYDKTVSDLAKSMDYTKLLLTGDTQLDKAQQRLKESTILVKRVFDDMLPKYQAANQLGVNPDAAVRSSKLESQLKIGVFKDPMFKPRALQRLNDAVNKLPK